jgi:hypothetical protein
MDIVPLKECKTPTLMVSAAGAVVGGAVVAGAAQAESSIIKTTKTNKMGRDFCTTLRNFIAFSSESLLDLALDQSELFMIV